MVELLAANSSEKGTPWHLLCLDIIGSMLDYLSLGFYGSPQGPPVPLRESLKAAVSRTVQAGVDPKAGFGVAEVIRRWERLQRVGGPRPHYPYGA